MELSEDDVIQILKLLDESNFDQLQLEVGDLKLSVSKSGPLSCVQDQPQSTAAPVAAVPVPAVTTAVSPEVDTKGTVAVKPVPSSEEIIIEEGLVQITAPLLGTFYSRPDPSAPPYVELGKEVQADDTVGLIEVMKLYTSVKAGTKGRIARICVESGQLVEYGQTLFLVEPLEA